MSQVSNVLSVVADLLRGEGGLRSSMAAVAAAEVLPAVSISDDQIITQNVSSEIAERSSGGRYPRIHIYCGKATNQLREKFRSFSGQVSITIEIRVSTDRIEGIAAQMDLFVDAVTAILDQNRGDWGAGIFFGGSYDIDFAGIHHGGKNFMQITKVAFDLDVSRN